MAADLQIPSVHAPRPTATILRRPAVWGMLLAAVGGVGGFLAWNARRDTAKASTPPATRQAHLDGLKGDYDVPKDEPARAEEKKPAGKPPKPATPRSRKVLYGKNGSDGADAFLDPNRQLASAEVAGWGVPLGGSGRASQNCELREGTLFSGQRAGGVLSVTRPVFGVGPDGEACVGLRPGASVVLEQDEKGAAFAVSVADVGVEPRPVPDWPVFPGPGGGRSGVYDIRVIGAKAMSQEEN